MRCNNISDGRNPKLYPLAVAIALVGVIGRVADCQQPADGSFSGESAHRHNNDMSCCAPCAPETNRDADVFKRPCFTRALLKSRQGFDAYFGLSAAEEPRILQEGIPAEGVEGFERLLTTVLQPGFLPREWGQANFEVPYPIRNIMEMRGGVATFVGHAVSRTAAAGKEINPSDPIQGAWTIDGIEVLPRTPNMVDRPARTTIRLRLHGAERLVIEPRPAKFVPAGVYGDNFGDFFDKAAFHRLLGNVLRVPFAAPSDLMLEGYDTEEEGVRVFVGKIRSRQWTLASRTPSRSRTPPHWWDEMPLLVTDSDPQYFCVSIVLGRDDVTISPQP